MRAFIAELRRRHVIRVAAAYVVGAVAVGGGAEVFLGQLAPSWVLPTVLWILVLGFPLAVSLAWAYDVGPTGVERDRGRVERGELLASEVVSAGPDPASIAVLPLLNLSGEADNEYFSDGVTDEILRHLAQLQGLKVISRTSVMRFKGTDMGIPEIARELGVGTVLEGSVQRAQGRVRVVVQLIDAHSDSHLWAETYDRDLEDVFATQSEIALEVSRALHASVGGDERRRIQKPPTSNTEAYDQYLLGKYHWYRFTVEGARRAGECFRRALELDPSYAAAYQGIADTTLLLGGAPLNVVPASEAVPEATQAAQRALELDPRLGDAYMTVAMIQAWFHLDWHNARETAIRGPQVDPSSSLAWGARAHTHDMLGLHDEAIAAIDRALELDPLSALQHQVAAWIYYHAGRFAEAERLARRGLDIEPGFPIVVFTLAEVLAAQGRVADALDVIEPSAPAMEAFDYGKAILAYVLGKAGKTDEATAHADALAELARGGRAAWAGAAVAYLGLGRRDTALEALAHVPAQRPAGGLMNAYLGVKPLFDELRGEEAFRAVLSEIGWTGSTPSAGLST